MKRINRYIIFTLAGFGLLLSASCKKWLDVNNDPNNLSLDNSKVEYCLTNAEYTIAYVLGNKYQEIGGFLSQYWTQAPSSTQYYDYDRYSFDGADGNREWAQLYAGALRDLKFVVDRGTEDGDSNYVAIAKILQAYTFQLISDIHGDIPFKEALQAQDGVLGPHYDSQEDVYDGCIALLNEANLLLDLEGGSRTPGADDGIFAGDMEKWAQFANTLKLRIALRQVNVRPAITQQLISELTTVNAEFLQEDASVKFFDKIGNYNPLYASILGLGVDNNVASKTIANYFNQSDTTQVEYGFTNRDYRSLYGFAATSGLAGTPQGAAAAGGYPSNAATTKLSDFVLGKTVPVILIGATETQFLQAEAIVRNYMTGDAQDLYETIVYNSLVNVLPDTGISSHPDPDSISNPIVRFMMREYMLWPGTQEDQLTRLMTEKWALMCGFQNLEAWCDIRRTGIPALTPSAASQLGAGFLPERIPYSNDEQTANSNFPGQKSITDKLWWAKQ